MSKHVEVLKDCMHVFGYVKEYFKENAQNKEFLYVVYM